jgi:hypothetical protein
VLCLRDEIGGEVQGRRGSVCDDRDLCRTLEPVDPDAVAHLELREGHVAVAGADDDVDGRDRHRPVRERRDRLRPSDRVHLVYAGDRARGERRGVDASAGRGRAADNDLTDTRDACRDRGHQDAGGIRGAASGDVAAGAGEGGVALAYGRAGLTGPPRAVGLRVHLAFVGGADAGGGELEGASERGIQLRERFIALVAGDRQALGCDAHTTLRLERSRIASQPNVVHDRAHFAARIVGIPDRAREARDPTRAAQVLDVEHATGA